MSKESLDILLVIWPVLLFPLEQIRLPVEQDRIVNRSIPLRAALRACSFPDDFILEVCSAENRIH